MLNVGNWWYPVAPSVDGNAESTSYDLYHIHQILFDFSSDWSQIFASIWYKIIYTVIWSIMSELEEWDCYLAHTDSAMNWLNALSKNELSALRYMIHFRFVVGLPSMSVPADVYIFMHENHSFLVYYRAIIAQQIFFHRFMKRVHLCSKNRALVYSFGSDSKLEWSKHFANAFEWIQLKLQGRDKKHLSNGKRNSKSSEGAMQFHNISIA